jgi:prevent-host-death family protein
MVKSLRESKARLSELVDAASRGEDVLITVRGKIKARLTRVEPASGAVQGRQWARELKAFQKSIASSAAPKLTTGQILDEVRADR